MPGGRTTQDSKTRIKDGLTHWPAHETLTSRHLHEIVRCDVWCVLTQEELAMRHDHLLRGGAPIGNFSVAARICSVLIAAVVAVLLPRTVALAFPSGPAATIATYSSGFGIIGAAGVAVDGAGNLYVTDFNCDVVQVKANLTKVALGSGPCGPFPRLRYPIGVAVGATSVFIADSLNCFVESIPIAGGAPTVVAGNGTCGYSGDGGPATSAELNTPSGVAVDGSGNLFIADTTNCRVREVSGGTITTFVGTGTCSTGVGAPGTAVGSVPIGPPLDVAVNGTTVYVITGPLSSLCQEFGTDGVIVKSPVFDAGSCGGSWGFHVAVSSTGSVYASFTDSASACEVRAIVANNTATTVAGTALCGYSGDGGPATAAELSNPSGLAVDGAGNLYIGDYANLDVRIVYAPVLPCGPGTDPDANGDTDFCNPGAGLPCVQDHIGDANNDGYSDSDAFTPAGAQTCTGAYPSAGGLGLNPAAACTGRNLFGTPAQVTAAKIARADANVDGGVNILDLSAAASAYGQSGFAGNPNDSRNEFDQNGDGVINILDLAAMAAYYGKLVPPC